MADSASGNFSVDTNQLVSELLRPATNNPRPGPSANESDPFLIALTKHLEGLRDDMKAQIEESKSFGDKVVALFEELKNARKTGGRQRPSVRDAGLDTLVLEVSAGRVADSLQNQNNPTQQASKSGRTPLATKDAELLKAVKVFTKVYKAGQGGVKGVTAEISESLEEVAEQRGQPIEEIHDPHARRGGRRDMMYDRRYGDEKAFTHKNHQGIESTLSSS